MPLPAPVTVVIATRNRATELLRTLTRLLTLPEHPPIVVVDNGSTDGTSRLVRAHHPGVQVVRLASNHGGAARTVGARLGGSPYVAFCDDDSWWAPGALRRAAELLGRHRRLAVLAARVLVGEVVAYHQPSPGRDPSGRRRTQVRNALWLAWLRRPLGGAARRTVHLAAATAGQPGARSGVLLALLGLPWVLRERRTVHPRLEAALRALDA